jgi:hypothetical protein
MNDRAYTVARELRDAGMAQAAERAPTWSARAYDAIVRVARRQPEVHIDDMLAERLPPPNHPNAWGAVWARAIKDRIIERTLETRPCRTDPAKHAHRYPVYRSRVCVTEGGAPRQEELPL